MKSWKKIVLLSALMCAGSTAFAETKKIYDNFINGMDKVSAVGANNLEISGDGKIIRISGPQNVVTRCEKLALVALANSITFLWQNADVKLVGEATYEVKLSPTSECGVSRIKSYSI